MSEQDLKAKTAKTAGLYFKGVTGERPYDLWRSFDPGLAKDLSVFVTGQMYAREKIPHPTRQLGHRSRPDRVGADRGVAAAPSRRPSTSAAPPRKRPK